jgi:hypothetical protein
MTIHKNLKLSNVVHIYFVVILSIALYIVISSFRVLKIVMIVSVIVAYFVSINSIPAARVIRDIISKSVVMVDSYIVNADAVFSAIFWHG